MQYCEDCTHCILGDHENKSDQLEYARCRRKPNRESKGTLKYISKQGIVNACEYCDSVRNSETCKDFEQ